MFIPELMDCFKDIISICNAYNVQWFCLQKTKEGHPSHPLYLNSKLKLIKFDVDDYLRRFPSPYLLERLA